MLRESEPKTVNERFSQLLERAESTDAYQIDSLKVEISERIYNAMKAQGVSNAELARRLGKSRAYVTKLLRGTTNFTLESLVRIGRALSCEVGFELLSKAPKAKAKAASAGAWETHSAKLHVRQPAPSFAPHGLGWVSEPREEFSLLRKPIRQVPKTTDLAVAEITLLKSKENACFTTAA